MVNDMEASTSAYASFFFRVLRTDRTVQDFIAEANPLLPFTYTIVARSLASTARPGAAPAGQGRNAGPSGRDQELSDHPNGCRDFT